MEIGAAGDAHAMCVQQMALTTTGTDATVVTISLEALLKISVM